MKGEASPSKEGDEDYYGGSSEVALKGRQADVRYRHEALLHDGRILVFGGGTRDTCVPFRNLDALDLARREWVSVATLGDAGVAEEDGYPAPRRCHAIVRHRDRVLVMGGFDGDHMYSDVWALDLASSEPYQWTRCHFALPKPLYFHSADITPVRLLP